MSDNTKYIDHDHSVCLHFEGGGHYVAATVVAADGTSEFLLINWEQLNDGQHQYSRTTPCHEAVGPLPEHLARRLRPAARCRSCAQPLQPNTSCAQCHPTQTGPAQ